MIESDRIAALSSRGPSLVEYEPGLCGGLALCRLGNGRYKLRTASVLDDPLRRLANLIEFPMPPRVFVWRIQNRPIEERVGHGRLSRTGTRLQRATVPICPPVVLPY